MSKISLRLVLVLVLAFEVCPSVSGQTGQRPSGPQAPGQIAKRAFPSVVLMLMQDATGQPISLGSGFFVRPNIVATNFHVIERATSGQVKIVGNQTKYKIAGIVALDGAHDLALIEVLDVSAPVLQLASTGNQAVGDEVYALSSQHSAAQS